MNIQEADGLIRAQDGRILSLLKIDNYKGGADISQLDLPSIRFNFIEVWGVGDINEDNVIFYWRFKTDTNK